MFRPVFMSVCFSFFRGGVWPSHVEACPSKIRPLIFGVPKGTITLTTHDVHPSSEGSFISRLLFGNPLFKLFAVVGAPWVLRTYGRIGAGSFADAVFSGSHSVTWRFMGLSNYS